MTKSDMWLISMCIIPVSDNSEMIENVLLPCHWIIRIRTVINVRIHHEYEGGIEKSVLRITNWHHEACGVMTNGGDEE